MRMFNFNEDFDESSKDVFHSARQERIEATPKKINSRVTNLIDNNDHFSLEQTQPIYGRESTTTLPKTNQGHQASTFGAKAA